MPYATAADFINNIKSTDSGVRVEYNGQSIRKRFNQIPKHCYVMSIANLSENQEEHNDNSKIQKLLKLKKETEELGLPTNVIEQKIKEIQDKNKDLHGKPDIIYRKSQALATDISISDVFQRSGYNYYALDKSKNDIKGKAWQSYILKSQEITRKEFETMRGDSQ